MLLLLFLVLCYTLFFFSPLQKKIMLRYRFLQQLHYMVNAENLHQLTALAIEQHFEMLVVEFNAESRRASLYKAFCKQLTLNVYHKHRANMSNEQQFKQQLQRLEELFADYDVTTELFAKLLESHLMLLNHNQSSSGHYSLKHCR